MRVLYFGSDALSLQVLTTLHKRAIPNGLISELAVVTPPDRMAGKRQRVSTPCVLKSGAKDLGIHTMDAPITPIRPPLQEWDPVMEFQRKDFKGDLAIAFSFGYFLPKSLIELFPAKGLNIHPSLLPKYRGPAPIQHALLNGDKETGVCIIEIHPDRFDAGRILHQLKYSLEDQTKTFSQIAPELADIGGNLLLQVLKDLKYYQERAIEQQGDVIRAPKLKATDKFVHNWENVQENVNKYRAFDSLYCRLSPGNQSVSLMGVRQSQLYDLSNMETSNGDCFLLKDKSALAIKFGNGWILVDKIKIEGKKALGPLEFYNGYLLRRPKSERGIIVDVFV